jgi:hypothetical protein
MTSCLRHGTNAIVVRLSRVPVVQWIEQVPPKNQIQVRLLAGTPLTAIKSVTAVNNIFQYLPKRVSAPSTFCGAGFIANLQVDKQAVKWLSKVPCVLHAHCQRGFDVLVFE